MAVPAASVAVDGPTDVVLDVAVKLSLEVGRAHMTIREFLKLAPGSIVVRFQHAGGDAREIGVEGVLSCEF